MGSSHVNERIIMLWMLFFYWLGSYGLTLFLARCLLEAELDAVDLLVWIPLCLATPPIAVVCVVWVLLAEVSYVARKKARGGNSDRI